jgi:hypothetical protein
MNAPGIDILSLLKFPLYESTPFMRYPDFNHPIRKSPLESGSGIFNLTAIDIQIHIDICVALHNHVDITRWNRLSHGIRGSDRRCEHQRDLDIAVEGIRKICGRSIILI